MISHDEIWSVIGAFLMPYVKVELIDCIQYENWQQAVISKSVLEFFTKAEYLRDDVRGLMAAFCGDKLTDMDLPEWLAFVKR